MDRTPGIPGSDKNTLSDLAQNCEMLISLHGLDTEANPEDIRSVKKRESENYVEDQMACSS